MKDYSEHETLRSLVGNEVVQLECSKCNRKYYATEEVVKAVDAGGENLCGYCDGSHQPEEE